MNKYDCYHYNESMGEFQNGCVHAHTQEEALAKFKALTPTAAHHRVVLSVPLRKVKWAPSTMVSFVDAKGRKSAEADIAWHNANKE